MISELDPRKARKIQSISELDYESTDDLPILDELIGQDRGLESLIFGLGIKRKGYNIYLSGPSGTGKKTAITQYLHKISKEISVPSDWCYIYNFDDPRKPKAIELIAGKGYELQKNMEWFINQSKESLEKAFSNKDYSAMLERARAVDPLIQMLEDLYEETTLVTRFLQDVKKDILDNISIILEDELDPRIINEIWIRYKINLLIDNSGLQGAPVIIEPHPTHNHLFGYLEKKVSMGYLSTDFSLIRSGSIHTANGGFLVLSVNDLFSNPYVWASIKRILKEGIIEIEDTPEPMEYITTKVLIPEPIPFTGKIIVLGDPSSFYSLSQLDTDFKELFKVKADFDSTIDWTNNTVNKYSRFISTICKNNKLKSMDSSAVASIIEYSSRLAGDQLKLSTRFGLITDFVYEVDYFSTLDESQISTKKHVNQALEKKIYRSNLY
jgi:predicted ATP-dependent protease